MRFWLLKKIVFLVVLFFSLTGATVWAQSRVINSGGGVNSDYSDGIELSLGYLGDIQMVANRVGHLYYSGSRPPSMGFSSVSLRLDGPTGIRVYARNNMGSVMTPVSQSAITGTGTVGSPFQVVTTFKPSVVADSGILVTLTDSYVFPGFGFTRRIDVSGLSTADTAKLYWNFDSMVGGNDSGIGYTVLPNTIGTRHPTTLEKLEFRYNASLGPIWDRYYTGYYWTPNSLITGVTGDLDNTVTASTVDAGMALQWNIPAGSTSFTAGSDLVYIPAGIFAREAFAPTPIFVNNNSRMTITLSTVNPTSSQATFRYTLPSGVTVATTPNLTTDCSPGGGTITASGSTINATGVLLQAMPIGGPAYTCTIAVDVTGTAPGTFSPSFSSSDVSVGHAATYGSLQVNAIALTRSKTASPTSFVIGQPASYTLRVTNGSSIATNAVTTITDTVPTGLTIGTLPAGCAAAGQTVTCTIAAGLAPGANASFVIPVTPTVTGSITNTMSITGGGSGCVGTTCSASVAVNVFEPQLTLVKSATPITFTVGVPASYTLTVTNGGGTATTAAATAIDTLPASLTIGTLPAGCTAAGQAVTCTIAAGLASGGVTSFTIPVTPTVIGSVSNTATVQGGGDSGCPATTRCVSTISATVSAPQLTLVKTATPSSFVVSAPASYVLTITNNGNAATTATATVSDAVPASLTLGTLPVGCTAAGQNVTCTIATGLISGGVASFIIPVTPTAVGNLSNTANVVGGGDPRCVATTDCASTITTVVDAAQLTVVKSSVQGGVSNNNYLLGNSGIYRLNVRNSGSAATVSDATITDTVPASLTLGASLPSDCTAVGQVVTCTVAAAIPIVRRRHTVPARSISAW